MGSIEPPGSSRVIGLSQTLTPFGKRESVSRHAASSLWFAFFINVFIGSIKYFAFVLSGSPSVFSESLHSFGDATNSLALIWGNHVSRRPADRTHPFGYALEANLWTIPACVLLLGFATWAVYEGWHRLLTPEAITTDQVFLWFDVYMVTVIVLGVSISLEVLAVYRASLAVVEELSIEAGNFFSVVGHAFANIRQVQGPTTRFVFFEESIALFGAVLALIAVTSSHFAVEWGLLSPQYAHYPDALTSIFIAFMLVAMAVYLFRHNRGILTQSAASPKVEGKIQELVRSLHGVSEVLDLKTVDHGLAGLTVHLQVQVDPFILVKDVDDLTDRIKERIQNRISYVSQVFVEVLADESEIQWGEKFEALIEQGKVEEVLDARGAQMLQNVYEFTEATVRDIMIPRTDVDAVELDTPLAEVADQIIESGHSRLPVYKETMDDLVGLVYARDVFERVRNGTLDVPLFELVREIDIYPENKPASDLLEDFKRNKIRIAAVADEHGGFAGLITVEDLVEEIIGELWDEHDDEEPMLTFMAPNKVLVNGKYDIEDINDLLDTGLPYNEFKTVGGYVFGAIGREPEEGDQVSFEDLAFTVSEVDGPRIISVIMESPVPFNTEVLQAQLKAAGNDVAANGS